MAGKLLVISIFDRAARAFGRPVYMNAQGVAVRSFTDEVNRSHAENSMYWHPDDFELYQVSVFDEDTGAFESMTPVLLAEGKVVKVRE